ncbi:MAG: hypothetical protein H7A55_15260 [Verrucomicrobiaceae bacterium]|nr:hypothetical protein [Verrucomicrobiaceae bacterium]
MSHSLSSSLRIALCLVLLAAGSAFSQSGYYAAGYYAGASYQQQQQAAAYAQQQAYAAYYAQQQQAAAYYAQQQQAAAYAQQQAYARQMQQQAYAAAAARQAAPAPVARAQAAAGALLRFDGRFAAASPAVPTQVQYAVHAGNSIQGKPYRRGGGHANVEDNAYDCSGSVSYVLIKAGLLRAPLSSSGFASYGEAGPGRFITIYVDPGDHVFMTVCGLRLDTSGGATGEGPRWRAKGRSAGGFICRHPAGF